MMEGDEKGRAEERAGVWGVLALGIAGDKKGIRQKENWAVGKGHKIAGDQGRKQKSL